MGLVRSGRLAVFVDEAATGGVLSDRVAGAELDNISAVGRSLTQPAVRAMPVVVLDVVVELVPEVASTEDDGAVEEFAANRGDPSLRVGVRDGRVGRGPDDRGSFVAEDLVEGGDELAGAVADEESHRSASTKEQVPGLLGGPRTGWVRGDAGEVDAAGVEFDEEQHVQAA